MSYRCGGRVFGMELKRYFAAVMVLLIVVSVFSVVSVWAQGPPELQRVVFVHYAGKKPPKPPGGENSYFKLIAGGVKWRSTATIEVNPTNSDLSSKSVLDAVTVSAEEWDDGQYSGWGGVSPNLFQVNTKLSEKTYDDLAWTSGKLDGANTLVWGNYPTSGVIAVTIMWYNTATKTMVEFDMVFDTDYAWSISGEAGKMDLQNIATHELGHGAGLSDLYSNAAYQETMYGYSDFGEVSKRDLYAGDIQGITRLYG